MQIRLNYGEFINIYCGGVGVLFVPGHFTENSVEKIRGAVKEAIATRARTQVARQKNLYSKALFVSWSVYGFREAREKPMNNHERMSIL